MKIVCASSVLFGAEAFSTLGEVERVPDDRITARILSAADALIVRSKTRVDGRLLAGSRVRFVGTATAGMDHLDTRYLDNAGIAWCCAPGCNAESVAEYITAALLFLAEREHLDLSRMTLGVAGVGQIGSRVVRKAAVLGLEVIQNDPPLRMKTGDTRYRPMEELMAHADIITFHVPLTRDGRFPTFHMADCKFFARLRPGVFLLNAARGAVIDSEALLLAMERDVVRNAVLDVWENEPEVNVDILNRVALGTPHIAGYSLDGKLAGTQQVYHEACHFFEEEPSWEPPALNPPPETNIYLDTRGLRDEEALWSLVRRIYDITQDDRQLRAASQIAPEYRAEKFNALRRDYPVRREFHSVTVSAPNGGDELTGKIAGLGFRGMFPDCEHDRFK